MKKIISIILTTLILTIMGCNGSAQQNAVWRNFFQAAESAATYQPYQYNWQQQQLNDQLNQLQTDHFLQQSQHNDNNQVLRNWKRSWNQIQQERQGIQRQYWPERGRLQPWP